MPTAIIHTAGSTVFQRSQAMYSVLVGGRTARICASSSLVPLFLREGMGKGGDDTDVLVIVPHTLITYLPSEGGDVGSAVRSKTEKLLERFKSSLLETIEAPEGEGIDIDIEDLKTSLDSSLRIRVVQARGNFIMRHDGESLILRFNGRFSHAFTQVFHFLTSGNYDRAVIDISQGWNHLTFSSYLGALAYREMARDIEVELMTTEPFTKTVKTCGGSGENPGKRDDPNPRSSERGSSVEGESKRASQGPRYELGLIGLEDVQLAYEALAKIRRLTSSQEAMIGVDEVVEIMNLLAEEFSIYSSLKERAWSGEFENLVSSLLRLRRAACALRTTNLTYLHHALIKLKDPVMCLSSLVDKLMGFSQPNEKGLDLFIREFGVEKSGEGTFDINYRFRPPLSLPISQAIVRESNKLLKALTRLDRPSEMTLTFLDAVHELYNSELGMIPNAILIEHELLMDQDSGMVVNAIEAVRNGKGGTVAKNLNRYYGFLEQILQSRHIPPHVLRNRDTFPFLARRVFDYLKHIWMRIVGTGQPDEEAILEKFLDPGTSWYSLRCTLANEILATGGGNQYVVNLRRALKLMEGDRISKDDATALERNMMAHLGILHYTIRGMLPMRDQSGKLNEVILMYYSEIFEKLEEMRENGVRAEVSGAQIPNQFSGMLSDLVRDFCTLCDPM